MPLTKPAGEQGAAVGECRQCRTFCDRLVEPRGCLELRCRYLYSYVDPLGGGRYMGCMRKVFRAEIDVAMFEAAERSGGYGGVKMTGEPLPQCQFRVEPSYERWRPRARVRQPRASSTPERAEPAFDLRDAWSDNSADILLLRSAIDGPGPGVAAGRTCRTCPGRAPG